MPTGGGVPPAVRNRARSVIVRSRSVSSARPSAVTLNETTTVCRCGWGRMPAWCRPWNGTAGSRPVSAASAAAWSAAGGPARPGRRSRRAAHPGGGAGDARAERAAQERPAPRRGPARRAAGLGAGRGRCGSRLGRLLLARPSGPPRLGDRPRSGRAPAAPGWRPRRSAAAGRGAERADRRPGAAAAAARSIRLLQPVQPGVDRRAGPGSGPPAAGAGWCSSSLVPVMLAAVVASVVPLP